MAHATQAAEKAPKNAGFTQPITDPKAMLLQTVQDFELDVASTASFVEFMDEHGDDTATAVADFLRPLLVRHQLVGSLMNKLVRNLP